MHRMAKEKSKNSDNKVKFDFLKPKYRPDDDYFIWDEEMIANRDRMFPNKISIKKAEQIIEYLDEIIEPIIWDYMDNEVYVKEYWEKVDRYPGVVVDLLENSDTRLKVKNPKSDKLIEIPREFYM